MPATRKNPFDLSMPSPFDLSKDTLRATRFDETFNFFVRIRCRFRFLAN